MAAVLTSAEVTVLEYQGQEEQGKADYRNRSKYRKMFVKITIDGAKGGTAGDLPASAFGLSKIFQAGMFTDANNKALYYLARDAGSSTNLINFTMADADADGAVADIPDTTVLYGYIEGIDDTDETDL